jgi:uncharacterized protein (TIGR00297 family)
MLDSESGVASRVQVLISSKILLAIGLTSAFAGGAWLLRGVTLSGALVGFAIALAVYLSCGIGGFLVLVSVFVVAWLTTRIGYRRKQQLGTAENARGRSAAQVIANLGAAAALCVMASVTGRAILMVAAIAAFSEAAADTAASECGQAWSRRAYVITTLRPVPAGTNGGISAPGTLAAIVAAILVSSVAATMGILSPSAVPVAVAAAILGTAVDSLLGATIEAQGLINNNAVNLAGTCSAGVLALAFTILQ